MKFRTVVVFFCALLLVMGCGSADVNYAEKSAVDSGYAVDYEEAMDAPTSSQNWAGADTDDVSSAPLELSDEAFPRMIIYNADLSLIVKDTVATQETITQIIGEWGGYISNAGSYAYDSGARNINITLRVPADNFNVAMSALRDMAMEVERESISSQDVTQEYVDLESRLSALEAKADRLEILMEEAEDTEAVLEVYDHLSATQMEIEQTKGRMRYLERSAAMATIRVQLIPDDVSQPVEIAGWRPQGTLKNAVEALIEAFQFLVDALIWIIILIVPVILFIALVIFAFIKLLGLIFKRRNRRGAADSTISETSSSDGS